MIPNPLPYINCFNCNRCVFWSSLERSREVVREVVRQALYCLSPTRQAACWQTCTWAWELPWAGCSRQSWKALVWSRAATGSVRCGNKWSARSRSEAPAEKRGPVDKGFVRGSRHWAAIWWTCPAKSSAACFPCFTVIKGVWIENLSPSAMADSNTKKLPARLSKALWVVGT